MRYGIYTEEPDWLIKLLAILILLAFIKYVINI